MLTDEKMKKYRERIRNGNKYMNGPILDIRVDYKELSRYTGITFVYRDSHFISYDFGYRNDLDINRYLTKYGY